MSISGVRAPLVPLAAVALSVLSIFLCYGIALAHDRVPSGLRDLPDITHCVLHQPARGVFVALFIPACLLIALSWVLGACALEPPSRAAAGVTAGRVSAGVGVVACGFLVMGEAALDPEPDWTVHVLGASGFFLLSMLAEAGFAVASSRSPRALTPASVRAKQAVAALNFALILLDACWKHNLIEWLLAFTVMGFHLTFAMDLRGSVLTMQQPSAGEPLLHS